MNRSLLVKTMLTASLSVAFAACAGDDGDQGPSGTSGMPGEQGPAGPEGQPGIPGLTPLSSDTPLSSMVALSLVNTYGVIDPTTGNVATDIAGYVRGLVALHDASNLPPGMQFPLKAAATDTVRALKGLHPHVVASWLDPLTYGADPIDGPRFGANADYIAYFGDGWDGGDGWDPDDDAPQFSGDDTVGYVWVNHEYISNSFPTPTSAPSGQNMVLARYLAYYGALANNIEASTWDASALSTYIHYAKKQLGGSWMRIVQDPATSEWSVVTSNAVATVF